MKKTLVSALSAALVVGAASTTFAASNPFSDVPANSWAYNAVATLAKDGVVNGFPNGTFQGQKTMTRYEMAQIVAKAMAYENMTKADKAIVDKLVVEFGSELQNLGVRVSNLEKKSDNVKLNGKVEYTYTKTKVDDHKYVTGNAMKFRLEPTAFIGNGVTAHARMDYDFEPNKDSDNNNNVKVDRVYVEGKIGAAKISAGKTPAFLANGLVFDKTMTGAVVTVGSDKTTVTAAAGRHNVVGAVTDDQLKAMGFDKEDIKEFKTLTTLDAYAGQVDHKFSDKVKANAGYLTLRGAGDALNTWFVGADATVADNVKLGLEYAKSNDDEKEVNHAYTAQLDYKGADAAKAGSFGVYAAYRKLGIAPSLLTTYSDGAQINQKGYEFGAQYVPAENIVATVKYFTGKDILTNEKANKVFARAEFLF